MPELQKVLITAQLRPENHQKLLRALEPAETIVCHPQDHEAIARCIDTVDAAILAADADEQILHGANLKWLHCCHAGLDKAAKRIVFSRGIVLTGSAGRSAPALAEHVFAMVLGLAYDMRMILKAQTAHEWCDSALWARSAICGKTMGVIGLGNTGKEVAIRAKAFGMRVLAWRRKGEAHPCVDRVYAADRGEALRPLLENSDYVVLCASLNNETHHLIDEKALAAMKPGAYLINIGRGGLVDEEALIRALRSGAIAGAGLDNFETEPLPADSPLWDLPNVILTPHCTPGLPDREERALGYVLQNIAAYRRGDGYVNRLTPRDVYDL